MVDSLVRARIKVRSPRAYDSGHMSSTYVGLKPVDGPRGGGGNKGASGSAGLGTQQVRHADGSDRPNYGKALLAQADAKHTAANGFRQDEQWG